MTFHKLTPNFEVSNIRETVNFYQSVLGFNLIMAVPEIQDGIEQKLNNGKEYVYALLAKDNVEIMLQRTDSFKQDIVLVEDAKIGASVSFYMEIEGLNELHHTIKNEVKNCTEPKTAWYGMREFYIKDPNGYILGFAEKTE
ncbi:VOC family protein [Ascidiimonas sp. W6]|uniref:VOC family protein n=1 Tax=Ascidiimonas meishanensis TaxID=3128903 RepID=UPI0030EDA39C